MPANAVCQMIRPPNRLAAKVPRAGGPDLSEVAKRAERDLRQLQDRYFQHFVLDIDRMSEALDHALTEPEDAVRMMNWIYCVSFELKGHGATFEFPLLALIADSLCNLIKDATGSTVFHLKLVELHLQAMKLVLKDKLRGAGGAAGQGLVKNLRVAVEQVK